MFAESYEKAQKEHGLGGSRFVIKEGENTLRVVSEPLYHETLFGKRLTKKFVCWVLDREDGQTKLYFMPTTILKSLAALQNSNKYGFTGLIPYDITIIAKGAGSKEVEYTVLPDEKVALTEQEILAISKLKPIKQVVENLPKSFSDNKGEEEEVVPLKEENDNEISADDIPF